MINGTSNKIKEEDMVDKICPNKITVNEFREMSEEQGADIQVISGDEYVDENDLFFLINRSRLK